MNHNRIIAEIDEQIERLQRARAALTGKTEGTGRHRRRKMSAAARARISAAQKARWAKQSKSR